MPWEMADLTPGELTAIERYMKQLAEAAARG